MKQIEVQQLTNNAVKLSLTRLYDYFENYFWPTTRSKNTGAWNRINEANLVLQLARCLSDRKFMCFPEAPYRDVRGKSSRIDLLCMNLVEKTLIGVEAKGDLAFVTPKDLLSDYNRLTNITINNEFDNYYNSLPNKWRFVLGIQLCYCWGEDLANWWCNCSSQNCLPPRRKGEAWSILSNILESSLYRGKQLLADWSDDFGKPYETFWGLYVIYPCAAK